MFLPVTDLNGGCMCDPARKSIAGASNVCGQAGLCANDGASATAHLSTNRQPVCRRTEGEVVLLPGSVPLHGVRAADFPGEPSRHRRVLACAALEALSPRDSLHRRAQHAGQCERGARLANLRRLRAEPDRDRPPAVSRRALRGRSEGVGVRTGHDDHRPVSVGDFLGAVPLDQGGSQVAHVARSARQISAFIHISDGKIHEVNILDQLLAEPGAFYILDRGFVDLERLYRFHEAGSFFVTRASRISGSSGATRSRSIARPD